MSCTGCENNLESFGVDEGADHSPDVKGGPPHSMRHFGNMLGGICKYNSSINSPGCVCARVCVCLCEQIDALVLNRSHV